MPLPRLLAELALLRAGLRLAVALPGPEERAERDAGHAWMRRTSSSAMRWGGCGWTRRTSSSAMRWGGCGWTCDPVERDALGWLRVDAADFDRDEPLVFGFDLDAFDEFEVRRALAAGWAACSRLVAGHPEYLSTRGRTLRLPVSRDSNQIAGFRSRRCKCLTLGTTSVADATDQRGSSAMTDTPARDAKLVHLLNEAYTKEKCPRRSRRPRGGHHPRRLRQAAQGSSQGDEVAREPSVQADQAAWRHARDGPRPTRGPKQGRRERVGGVRQGQGSRSRTDAHRAARASRRRCCATLASSTRKRRTRSRPTR